jgi:CheY-like chemotaxis protein
VLLVEDNDQVRHFAATLLRDLGCEVTAVADGRAALGLIGQRRFDLVFSDVVMPGISGIELARRLAERGDAPPVLLASGYNDQYPVEAHGFSLIKKPYDARSLRQAMADLHRDRADRERNESPA